MEELANVVQYTVGVCCMKVKGQSTPMLAILSNIEKFQIFKVFHFPESLILEEPIEKWPVVDFLISFFSPGLPLEKIIAYTEKYPNIFCVNDPTAQFCLTNRANMYNILKSNNIPTVPYIFADRSPNSPELQLVEEYDYIIINGERIDKPFVEKPVSGEDHNIYIYYPKSMGGGTTKLFRKIGNKSSEKFPDEWKIRRDGSYLYEEFVDTQNSQDIKMYAVGSHYCHAESRKSPVVDGVVLRNESGREIRHPVVLSDWEKEIARRVVLAFNQRVCGFDLLRGKDKSYVCDVNGWSFVKSNPTYSENCAKQLREMFLRAIRWRGIHMNLPLSVIETNYKPKILKNTSFACFIGETQSFPFSSLAYTFSNFEAFQFLGEHKLLSNDSSFAFSFYLDPKNMNYKKEDWEHRLNILKLWITKQLKEGTQIEVVKWEQKFSLWQLLYDLFFSYLNVGTTLYISRNSSNQVNLKIEWGGVCTPYGIEQTQNMVKYLQKHYQIQDLYSEVHYFHADFASSNIIQNAQIFMQEFAKNSKQDNGHSKFFSLSKDHISHLAFPNFSLFAQEKNCFERIFKSMKELVTLASTYIKKNTLYFNETLLLFQWRWAVLCEDFFDPSTSTFSLSTLPRIWLQLNYDILNNQTFLFRYDLVEIHHSLLFLLRKLSQHLKLPSSDAFVKHLSQRLLQQSSSSSSSANFYFCDSSLYDIWRNFSTLQVHLNLPEPLVMNTLSHLIIFPNSPQNPNKFKVLLSSGETLNIFSTLAKMDHHLPFQPSIHIFENYSFN